MQKPFQDRLGYRVHADRKLEISIFARNGREVERLVIVTPQTPVVNHARTILGAGWMK